MRCEANPSPNRGRRALRRPPPPLNPPPLPHSYAIVPSVCPEAVGVVSGLVGAGGNLGAVATQLYFFSSAAVRTDASLISLGWTVVLSSALCLGLYFSAEGGMLCGRGGWGRYEPQLWRGGGGAAQL